MLGVLGSTVGACSAVVQFWLQRCGPNTCCDEAGAQLALRVDSAKSAGSSVLQSCTKARLRGVYLQHSGSVFRCFC